MRRHHRGMEAKGGSSSSSSDEEEDAFSALSRKKRKMKSSNNNSKDIHGKKGKGKFGIEDKGKDENKKNDKALIKKNIILKPSSESLSLGEDNMNNGNINLNPAAETNANMNTSSNKRHHHKSSARAAKMDTLLQELEQTSKSAAAATTTSSSGPLSSSAAEHRNLQSHSRGPPPDKMGSFVSIEEEPFTTNIFVGNLSPLTTEEQLTEIFRQFGDLYSVKIMWPRTPEEHARGRNTGFVCFMNRDDAQEAINAFDERDPLRTGRRMMLRWGKNVKKIVKRGTGGVIPQIRKKSYLEEQGGAHKIMSNLNRATLNQDTNLAHVQALDAKEGSDDGLHYGVVKYDESKHYGTAIKVVAPKNQKRLDFITTVASFVAKDGSILEQRLLDREKSNPLFSFLYEHCENKQERIFYRWRVFAFAQGDSFDSWRTEPFIMIQPNGRFWIPPPLDKERAMREKMEQELKEDQIRIKQERRRQSAEKEDFMTGRQMESMKKNKRDGGMIRLHPKDLDYWNHMIDKKLCASRDAICEAMAFCFEKSSAALHISELLKDILMDNRKGISVDTKIARLYLMSDILYNSQQPGVRNAFKYRDAIERMALEIFGCLGSHGNGSVGRMTMNKLRNAVMEVLNAWAKWSVYNSAFLNQLEAAFDGKPIEDEPNEDDVTKPAEVNEDTVTVDKGIYNEEENSAEEEVHVSKPISMWVEKSENETQTELNDMSDNIDGEDLDEEDLANGFVDIDADLDGESLHESDFDEEYETKSNSEP